MRPAPVRVRTYALFGESAHLPDVLHCETIAARSVLHDWEFAPHRHGRLHQVMLGESGGGDAQLDGTSFALQAGSLVNVPAGSVHGFRFARGTQGYVATMPDELVDALLAGSGDVHHDLRAARVVTAPRQARQTLRQIWREFNARSAARALVLRGLAATLLGLTARALADSTPPTGAREPPLLRRFDALLEAHYCEHWTVSDYARALAVTPTHLSRIARATTGQALSRLIDARLAREARRQLAYTSMSVKTIAYALGFADPAYFSRVFTRTVGVSPRRFRAQVG
jgi:AraC family transcriptional activator of pobA